MHNHSQIFQGVSRIYKDLIPQVLSVAKRAAVKILEIYDRKDYQINSKLDNSPVTEADLMANKIISEGLLAIDPKMPIMSEEGVAVPFEVRSKWSRYWLVDPLDGTREFIQGTGEFTINIALVENHMPVLGVIVVPKLDHYYWGSKGDGAFFQAGDSKPTRIEIAKKRHSPLKIAVSRQFHSQNQKHKDLWNALVERLGPHELIYCGSALKICLVAKGEIDLYPRLGAIGEWDLAAGQCILEEAGGYLRDLDNKPLRYNTEFSFKESGFFAVSDSHLASLCCG